MLHNPNHLLTTIVRCKVRWYYLSIFLWGCVLHWRTNWYYITHNMAEEQKESTLTTQGFHRHSTNSTMSKAMHQNQNEQIASIANHDNRHSYHGNMSVRIPPKLWEMAPPPEKWCRPNLPLNNNNRNLIPGLIYIKVPKTGSSTCLGIQERIARKIGSQVLTRRNSTTNTHEQS